MSLEFPETEGQARRPRAKAKTVVERTADGKKRAARVIRFIETLTVPSGQGHGRPFKLMAWQKRFIRDIYEPHVDGKRAVRRAILSIARKNGKDFALDTLIPTPHGWSTMGRLREGDEIFDENGAPCRVTFKSPVFIGHRCYRLKFADGSVIVAGEDHQWLTKSKGKTSVVTTAQIAESLLVERSDGGVERNHKIQIAGAIECPQADLPIPPYVLGYWLGNGNAADAQITVGRQDEARVVEELERELAFELTVLKVAGDRAPQYGLTQGRGGQRAETIQVKLRGLGVLNDKHIPDAYLWASREQRLALLQGLMDSDGTASGGNRKAPRCCFDVMNKRLASGALQLIRSLGHKTTIREDVAKIAGRPIGPVWSVSFTAYQEDRVFRLQRRGAGLPPRPERVRRSQSNAIVDCDEIPSVPTQCIQVDSPSRLFLAGEGFTPTHNTALIAALALAHLAGPEKIANGEIYSAANDRDQAAIVFKFAAQMVRLDPELQEKISIIPSTKTMIGRVTGSVYRAVSREATTKHGFSPSVVIYDELAQAKSRTLYDVLDTSFGAREEPLFIAISTQSNDPEHILSKLIDDGLSGADPSIICHLYAADEECELDDKTQWLKANPALGVFRDREDLATAIRKAMRMPAEEPKVRNLFLNQRVALTAPLISRPEWMGCVGEAKIEDREEVYLGLDLSSVNDLTALIMVTVDEPVRVQPFFWKPRDTLIDQSKRDFGAGSYRYMEWADEGHLLLSPGKTIDPLVVATFIGELHRRYRIRGLAYDRYGMGYVRKEFDRIGLQTYEDDEKRGSGLRLVAWGQGYVSMGPAIDAFERAVLDGKLVHNGNPVLNWNVSNAVTIMDPAGNRKLDKEKARFRIDGAVALAMAMGLRARDRTGKPIDVLALIG